MTPDHEKELTNKRLTKFIERSKIISQIPVAMFKMVPVTEDIKNIFSQRVEGFMEMSPEAHVYDTYTMPADDANEDLQMEKSLAKMLDKNVGILPSDIFFSNTIPVKHIIIQPKIYSSDKIIDTYDLHVIDDDIRIKNIQRVLNGETDEADVMWIRHTAYATLNGVKGWVRAYNKFVVEKDTNYISLKKIVYYDTSAAFKNGFDNNVAKDISQLNIFCEEKHQCMMEVYAAWYTLQQCILTKELATYVKKTRTTMDFMKTQYVSNKNKKLINKYIIQLEKIQEAFMINEENSSDRKYRKPLWHVTGHWRHYKSGKTVFVQGYWKGAERNNTDIYPAPVEISLENWIYISNNNT